MELRIAQHAAHDGKDAWHWSIWLEGPQADLDQIVQVEYTLHPTFTQPVHVVDDRSTNFRLSASGWGEFEVQARARTRDEKWHPLRHWLTLRGVDANRAPTRGLRPVEAMSRSEPKKAVYITGSYADKSVIEAAKTKLVERGFAVTTSDDFRPGVPFGVELETTISRVDAVVGVISDRPSHWLDRELELAASRDVPVIPVTTGGRSEAVEGPAERAMLKIGDDGEISPADADSLAEAIELSGSAEFDAAETYATDTDEG